jgi:Helix-turn-helix domain
MKQISKETKTYKLLEAFKQGEIVTQAQAEKRFGIKNLAAEASRLRYNGHAIYAKSRKAGNGVHVTEYRLDRPTREIVALGYKARALGITL